MHIHHGIYVAVKSREQIESSLPAIRTHSCTCFNGGLRGVSIDLVKIVVL